MGEGKQMMSMGKSLLVPSVQELVSKQDTPATMAIPSRYIHSDPLDQIPIRSSDHLQVPIIDIQALLAGDPLELQRLHSACRDWGFFQVVNHGVDTSLIERFKEEVKEFFNLPMEEKRIYWQTEEEVEGFGQVCVLSEEQKLDWSDMFFLITLPKSLQKPHLLPVFPLPFRFTLETYSKEVNKLAIEILDCMGRGLGMEANGYLSEHFENGLQWMKMNYYPPCPEPEKVIGLTPHTDSAALTILLEINEIDGLQIMKDGGWIPIKPLPNSLVVNLGNILEIVSNGEYRCIEHRAVVNSSEERMSVATFHFPGLEKEIGPAPCLIKQEKPAQFRNIKLMEYLKGLLARKLDSKSYLDLMRI